MTTKDVIDNLKTSYADLLNDLPNKQVPSFCYLQKLGAGNRDLSSKCRKDLGCTDDMTVTATQQHLKQQRVSFLSALDADKKASFHINAKTTASEITKVSPT